jgi:hypothetical protein
LIAYFFKAVNTKALIRIADQDVEGTPEGRINVVIGYKEDKVPAPSGTIGVPATVSYERTVGFYNSQGALPNATVPLSTL